MSNSSWHGTHVSGTIGAVSDNGIGVAGINQNSKIQPLRVLGKCGGYTSDIADAIRWSAGLPVSGIPNNNPTPDRVVNISLGGSGACDSVTQSAINAAVAAGTVVVVAAGNSNSDASNFTPANCNNVITVAATGHTGSRAYYSNYGTSVEIAAPGGDAQLGKTILSTLNAGTQGPGADSYANYQGTSMATPHVVGIVSLMLSLNPSLTPAQVTTMLQATATPFPGWKHVHDVVVRSGHRQRRRGSHRCAGWWRAGQAGAIREDVAREHGIDRRHLCQPAVGPERRRCELRVLRRHRERQPVCRQRMGERCRCDVGHGDRARAGDELLLAGEGDEYRRRHGGGQRRLADLRDPVRRRPRPPPSRRPRRGTAHGTSARPSR